MDSLNKFYLNLKEPKRSCFFALREIILAYDDCVQEAWKYRLPFFNYKGKMFCYLWQDKNTDIPYIGICRGDRIEHPSLYQGDRKKIQVLSIDPNRDIPVELIYEIFDLARGTY